MRGFFMPATGTRTATGAANDPRATPRPLDRLHQYLERLAETQFFGKIVVSFQHGKVHDIRVEQTKKLEEL
jgi:hypothetical protein